MSDILIVDDERDIRELVGDILRDEGFETRLAGGSDACLKEISEAVPSLMVLDIWLKDSEMDGIDILKHVKREHPEVPIIIISGHGNIEIAVAAIKQGAYDFIEKPFNIDQLMVVVRRAMETSRLRRENATLKRSGGSEVEMYGVSPAFKVLKGNLEKVTKSNGRVMLTGCGGRQGGCGAVDPHQFRPQGRALCHRVLGHDRTRPDGRGAVRARKCRARHRKGAVGRGQWRCDLFRRGGGYAVRHPVENPAGVG